MIRILLNFENIIGVSVSDHGGGEYIPSISAQNRNLNSDNIPLFVALSFLVKPAFTKLNPDF